MLTHECKGNASYKHLSIKQENIDLYYKNKPRTYATVPGKAYYDYSRYNTERLPAFGQLDVRVDKTFYLKKCMLGFYLDIQNVTGSKLRQPDVLMSTGEIANPEAPAAEQRYVMKSVRQESGTLLPTLGITFEY